MLLVEWLRGLFRWLVSRVLLAVLVGGLIQQGETDPIVIALRYKHITVWNMPQIPQKAGRAGLLPTTIIQSKFSPFKTFSHYPAQTQPKYPSKPIAPSSLR